MKKFSKKLSLIFFMPLFFGTIFFLFGVFFISAYYAKFAVDTPVIDVFLNPFESSTREFNVFTDVTYPYYSEGEAIYSIAPSTVCNQEDEESGDCLDEAPNLCPYLTLEPNSEESTEIGFSKNSHFFTASGELNLPVDEEDSWNVSISSPCFDGECPVDYNEDVHGQPLPLEDKGKIFKCNLYISSSESPPSVRNFLGPKLAFADDVYDTIQISATFSGGVVNTRDPVIIIPGIIGSYLNKNYDDLSEIWPDVSRLLLPGPDNFLNDLALNIDGTENPDFPILVGDIIREEAGSHVFDGLINNLENAGYVENTDLFVFPYDWRKSNTDNAILLEERIDEILSNIDASKVDIVAHSMGGILAKTYIANADEEKIDQIIFLGTPHLGAPKAFKALMYGDDMGFGLDLLGDQRNEFRALSPNRMKFISQNMPSAYELLPSKKYINKAGGYVLNGLDKNNIFTYNYLQTKELMILNGRNGPMLQGGETLHNDIDDLDLSGLEVHNFVGCGSKTVGEITLKKKFGWFASGFKMVDDYDLKYVNGDETVPLISADDISSANIYYAKEISHGTLPSADGVKEDVVAILSGDTLPGSENILTDTSTCKISGKNVSVHSPVELHIYDEEGNHAGPNEDGDIEINIPGVAYDVIEGEKFAFLPDGINYQVITKATEVGGYNLAIKEQNEDDEIVSTKEWILIPLKTIDAEGEIWVGPDYPKGDYQVAMDNNGDGIFEENVIPNKGEEINVKAYLKAFRIMIEQLDIKQEIKKALLVKIDKLEKKLEKDKKGKLNNKIIKFIQKFGDLKKEHGNNHKHEDSDDHKGDDKKSKDNKVLSEKELFIKFLMNLLEELD